MEQKVLVSRVQCKGCGETLQSNHRHDFVKCSCGLTFLDGGWEYKRCSGDPIDQSLTTSSSYKAIRKYLKRGSRGKDGDKPLTWVSLRDIEDDYVLALLKYCEERGQQENRFYPYYLMEKEYRGL